MTPETFEAIAAEEFARVPERFARLIENVALLVEDEPDRETREKEGLTAGETLLGLYRGIPATLRGSSYGVGATLPDTITLYRFPILAESGTDEPEAVRTAIRETLWHEIGHYFGMGEEAIHGRESKGTNEFRP